MRREALHVVHICMGVYVDLRSQSRHKVSNLKHVPPRQCQPTLLSFSASSSPVMPRLPLCPLVVVRVLALAPGPVCGLWSLVLLLASCLLLRLLARPLPPCRRDTYRYSLLGVVRCSVCPSSACVSTS